MPLTELEYQLRAYNFTTYTKQQGSKKRAYTGPHAAKPLTALDDAYNLLGVTANDDNDKIKKAYRRLMSKYHPDKLVAKGLPTEMLNVAKEKTQQISAAYDLIMRSRK